MGQWVVSFAGLALVYALLTAGVLLVIVRLITGAYIWRAGPLALVTLWFVFMALHPFPGLDDLNCPVPTAVPQTQLFGFLERIDLSGGLSRLIWDRTVASTVMNFVICFGIGLSLSPLTNRLYHALIFGFCLSLGIELTQLTGLWGLYPCAYRQFDVDDLITNVSGVVAGAAVMGKMLRSHRKGRFSK